MAVYTEVSDSALAAFLADYDVGDLLAKTPIVEGVENTNYKINAGSGPYILTLFEKRVREEDLPFFMAMTSHLAGKGLKVAAPVADRNGAVVKFLAGRPAALIRFLPGEAVMTPAPAHARALGATLADLHAHVADFALTRDNPLSLSGWRRLAEACGRGADRCAPGLAAFIEEELDYLTACWPAALPGGVVHTDLFPDNVLFDGDEIAGVIDFYFSCTDFFAYDAAVCINAWCFDGDGVFLKENASALMKAYSEKRIFTAAEREAFSTLLRGAALRFLLTRAYDWLNQVEGAMVTVKDPLEYKAILEFHRSHYAPALYGF